MFCKTLSASLALLLVALPLAGAAASDDAAANNADSAAISRPRPLAPAPAIAPSRDIPYPGTIAIAIDATDVDRGIFTIRETIPVITAGTLTLLLPKWLPGHHAPEGEIDKIAGLSFTANGAKLAWRRDPVEVYAYHVAVPAGAGAVTAEFQFLSATAADQGPIVTSPEMLRLQFIAMTLYPAGYYTRQIPVEASVRYPAGWTAYSSLPATVRDGQYHYRKTTYDVLADSPAMAGQNARQWMLDPHVFLDVVADDPAELAASDAQIEAHRALVQQTLKLFQARHYDDYHLLLSISPRTVRLGLEHHQSSEDGALPGYFTRWGQNPTALNLIPHEFTHSWNGKFRRGADLWTPDFHTPMRDSLLWVYEGQTQFWGYVLQARAGLVSKEDTLDQLAMIAAALDAEPARGWRPLIDTTNDPILSERRPKGWVSWQRSEDYYNEGLLLWLEVDAILRNQSGGRHTLDDFARAFFGVRDGDTGTLTYTRADVVAALNAIQPYDWAGLFRQRVDGTAPAAAPHAPLAGLEGNGYRLTYSAIPSPVFQKAETARQISDLRYSLGLVVGNDGAIQSVIWNSPAFQAGLTVGDRISAVAGDSFSGPRLKKAVEDGQPAAARITLLVRRGDLYRTVVIDYHGGARYPHLEKIGKGVTGLDKLLAPL